MDAYQHLKLLERAERLQSLRSVIFDLVKPGNRVLDAGSGAGILSIWAAQAGASDVLGVDLEGLPLAQSLAVENGVQDRVQFIRDDLRSLDPEDVGQFDVIFALLYLNDPRRDTDQQALVKSIRERFLARGGSLVPDIVRYTAILVEWSSQDHEARRTAIKPVVAKIEVTAQLRMSALYDAVTNGVFLPWFPPKTNGRYAESEYRRLSQLAMLPQIDYSQSLTGPPEQLELGITDAGIATAVVWTQELLAGEIVLFTNESISWLERPISVQPGSSIRLGLGSLWKDRNVLSVDGSLDRTAERMAPPTPDNAQPTVAE